MRSYYETSNESSLGPLYIGFFLLLFLYKHIYTIHYIRFLNEAMKKKKKKKNSFDYLLVTNIYFMKELYMLSIKKKCTIGRIIYKIIYFDKKKKID